MARRALILVLLAGCFRGGFGGGGLSIDGSGQPSDGVLPASLAVAVAATGDTSYGFGSVDVGDSAEVTLSAINAGGQHLTLELVDDRSLGLSSPFTYAGGDCLTDPELDPGDSCNFILRFVPTFSGDFATIAVLHATTGAEDVSAMFALSGTGTMVRSVLSVSAPIAGATYDFGTIAIDTSKDVTLTVKNYGARDVTLGSVDGSALELAAPFELVGGNCTSALVLTPTGSCTLEVRFAPTLHGNAETVLTISGADALGEVNGSLGLQGSASGGGALSITGPGVGPGYDFGAIAIDTTTTTVITVQNSGTADITLGDIDDAALGLTAPLTIIGGSCTSSLVLAPTASCTLIVQFAPVSLSEVNETLVVGATDILGSLSGSLALHGSGSGGGALILSPPALGTSYDFGTIAVNASTSVVLVLENSGTADVTLGTMADASLQLSPPFSRVDGDCTSGQVLAPMETCTLVVEFAPTTLGGFDATLSASGTDKLGAVGAQLTLHGSSTSGAGALSVSAPVAGSPYDYGSLDVGTSASVILNVQNTGLGNVTLGAISSAGVDLADPFSLVGGSCTGNLVLAPSDSCSITVQFAPATVANFDDTVVVPGNDALGPLSGSLALHGSAAGAAASGSSTLSLTDADDGMMRAPGGIWSAYQVEAQGEDGGGSNWVGSDHDTATFAFLRFTLDKNIPALATITDATLSLWGTSSANWSATDALFVMASRDIDAPVPSGENDVPIYLFDQNLMPDPGFELGTGDFVTGGSATISQDTTTPLSGTGSLSVAITGYGDQTAHREVEAYGVLGTATQATASATLRRDNSSSTDVNFCVRSYYVEQVDFDKTCVTSTRTQGSVSNLNVSAALNPALTLYEIDVAFETVGASEADFTIDDTSLVLTGATRTHRPGDTSVRWPASGGTPVVVDNWATSPSIASILQELVDNDGGLAAGSVVTIWVGSTVPGGDYGLAFEDASQGTHLPKLDLSWTSP